MKDKETIYYNRIEKTKREMAKAGIDVFFVSPSSNLFYLAGYAAKGDERLFLLALPLEGAPFVLANLLYQNEVQSLPIQDAVFWKDGDDPFVLLKSEIERRKISVRNAALEPSIPAMFSLPLVHHFPTAQFSLGSTLTGGLREIKEPDELEIIRRAGCASDRALEAVIGKGSYWLGKTELEFRDALFAELRREGIESPGAAVAVGANAAVPHHLCGNTVIESGKCLLVDFWGRLEGYYTDCTRTFFVGEPDRKGGAGETPGGAPPCGFEKAHAIVLEAHMAAEAAARPGNTLGDVDKAARSVIESYGYGEYFTHRTGHGAGIDVHEGNSAGKGVETPIVPGMVFSIEPGLYFPGYFGVRIENLVITGENAAQPIHAYPRELRLVN